MKKIVKLFQIIKKIDIPALIILIFIFYYASTYIGKLYNTESAKNLKLPVAIVKLDKICVETGGTLECTSIEAGVYKVFLDNGNYNKNNFNLLLIRE